MAAYIFEHEGVQFTPDGRVEVSDTQTHNAAIEQQELDYWTAKPDRFAAYDSGGRDITTWKGVVIGTVIERNTYTNNLGARITSLKVRGSNGACYHGRYGSDWSQLVRLRKCK